MEDIKVIEKKGTVTVETGPAPDTLPTPLQGFLGVDRPTTEESQKLKEVWDFIEGDSEADRLYKIQQLENRLGSPSLGQSRLDLVYEYAKLTKQITTLEKMRDGLQGNSSNRR